MNWKDSCFAALDAEKMFESSGHRTRFKELLDCYYSFPFFTKGLCKCMYMSAWDEEHFCVLLETLTDLSLGRETTTTEMRIKGDALADENTDEESYVYHFSVALLEDAPFRLDETVSLSPGVRYLIRRTLRAAAIIDRI